MKKKVLGVLLLLLPVLFLTACSNNDSLDGNYYEIDDDDFRLEFKISGDEGYEESGNYTFKVNEDLKTFAYPIQLTYSYEYKDGILKVKYTGSGGYTRTYYKQGSQAEKDAMKKYNKSESDREN